MVLKSVPKFETAWIMNTLKGSLSSGPEIISTRVFHAILLAVLSPLARLVNLSFKKGIFSESFKQAKAIVLYKSGSWSIPANYRPVSLLSVFSKIFEKTVLSRLLSFWDSRIFVWFPVWILSKSLYRACFESFLEFHSFGNRCCSYPGSFIFGYL